MKKLKAQLNQEKVQIPPLNVEEMLTKIMSRELDLEITIDLLAKAGLDEELIEKHRNRRNEEIKTLNARDWLGGNAGIHL